MKIITLAENTSVSEAFRSEHGLSLYIETETHKLLFDVGASSLFAENAEKLGIDLSEVDVLVISHGHYDHGGGLKKFLELNDKAAIYINRKAFENHYSKRDQGEAYIGLDQELFFNNRFVFLDEDFARLYKEERQNAQLAVLFAILAIFIAALGLFGLTSFAVEQRTKEIGIRKTMGASVYSIFFLISKEIIVLVTISTAIAIPIAFYLGNGWLQNYYYRISLGVFDFIVGFVIAILIALATISYRTIKAARANPVDSLLYE